MMIQLRLWKNLEQYMPISINIRTSRINLIESSIITCGACWSRLRTTRGYTAPCWRRPTKQDSNANRQHSCVNQTLELNASEMWTKGGSYDEISLHLLNKPTWANSHSVNMWWNEKGRVWFQNKHIVNT